MNRNIYKDGSLLDSMNNTRLIQGSLFILAAVLVAFAFFGMPSKDVKVVDASESFPFLNTDGLVLQQTGTPVCSGFTPATACTAASIGTRLCAARGGGACGCSCVDSTNPRWLCAACASGRCDSNNQKCEPSTPSASIGSIGPR